MHDLALSLEVQKILGEAHFLAREAAHPVGTLHLLLAIFSERTHPNQAHSVLQEHGIRLDEITGQLKRRPDEPDDSVGAVIAKCHEVARFTNSSIVNSLHLLVALTRLSETGAYRILRHHHPDINDFRTELFDLIGTAPRQLAPRQPPPPAPASTPGPRGLQPPAFLPEPAAGASFDGGSHGAEPGEPHQVAQVGGQRTITLEAEAGPLPVAPAGAAEARRQYLPRSRFELDPQRYPTLCEVGRNLTLEAERGVLDPLVGRDKEIEDLRRVLGKKRANNPCLIGSPGVGKTAIVEGFALEIVKGTIDARVVIKLDASSLVAGTHFRGSFAERLKSIREEVESAEGGVIIFADEIHQFLRAGSGDSGIDAGNDLKEALARGTFPCIGATTDEEYRRHIMADPALERRFQPIVVPEPRPEEAIRILTGIRPYYERHHGDVHYPDALLERLVRSAHRYVTDRALPDSAINLMDLAGSTCHIEGSTEVTDHHLAKVLANLLQIPEDRVVVDERGRLLDMERVLGARVVGHEENLRALAEAIRRNYAGFSTHRPMGSFLFLGPPSVGKKEVARALAEFLFGADDALTVFKMGEYAERHDVTKLLGAPPSYVGFEEGGAFARHLLKRPYQILVFHDIDKAHPTVQTLLAQILESGEATDNRGRHIDFSNCLVVATSTLGSERFASGRAVGFVLDGGAAAARNEVLAAAERALQPELWHAFDEKLLFPPLKPGDHETITRLLLDRLRAEHARERGLRFTATDGLVSHLITQSTGGRADGPALLGQMVRKTVNSALSDWILRGGRTTGVTLHLDHDGHALVVTEVVDGQE
jgi:ATP-dependent Clp protease ATP-binding subunit ClpC